MRSTLRAKMLADEQRRERLLKLEARKREMPDAIQEWKELDPWGLFIEARCNLIDDFMKQGMSCEHIAVTMSISAPRVEQIANREIK